jgi:hypothetical protein
MNEKTYEKRVGFDMSTQGVAQGQNIPPLQGDIKNTLSRKIKFFFPGYNPGHPENPGYPDQPTRLSKEAWTSFETAISPFYYRRMFLGVP